MAAGDYEPITPVTAVPADGTPGQTKTSYDELDCFVDVSSGSITAALLELGPGGAGNVGKWRQRGPSWTVDTSLANGQPGRISVPREKRDYALWVSDATNVTGAWLVGVMHGR